jgi:hypothetical protein
MQLDTALSAPEGRPGKQGQAEAHHRGVQTEELVFEPKFVLRGQWLTTPVHQAEEGFKKRGGPPVIGVGKRRTGYRTHAQMVKIARSGFEGRYPIPQAGPGSDLHEDQVHQLMPTAKSARRTPGAVLPLQFGKMMSRNQSEHVMKDCVTMSHGLKSPVCFIG